MHLGLYHREQIAGGDPPAAGRSTADQFQRNQAELQVWSEAEHKDDGTHGAITADTLHVAGTTDLVGDVTLEGDLAVAGGVTLDGAATLDGEAAGPDTQQSVDTYPTIVVIADVSRNVLSSSAHVVPAVDNALDLGLMGSGELLRRWKSIIFTRTCYGPKVVATQAFYERNRTVPLGEWQPIPFAAANFTTDVGGAAWAVTAGQVVTNQFTVIGKTLLWDFFYSGTSVTGAPGLYLLVKLPAPYRLTGASSATHMMPLAFAINNGTLVPARAGAYSPTQVSFNQLSGAPWSPAAGTTSLAGTLILSVETTVFGDEDDTRPMLPIVGQGVEEP